MRTGGAEVTPASLEFDLPEHLIAQDPAKRREDARLLVYERSLARKAHARISQLTDRFRGGDLLVLNDTRVEPARVVWRKPGGGVSELLFLRCLESEKSHSKWEVLLSGKRIRMGEAYRLEEGLTILPIERLEKSRTIADLTLDEAGVRTWLKKVGKPPLPPYILSARKRAGRNEETPEDAGRYQTVYAKVPGAVAAPTAGLHFSPELLERLRQAGVEIDFLTLHVGWGTFQPVDEEIWRRGKLHAEWVNLGAESAKRILRAKQNHRRVVAVGTTVVRSIEWWAAAGAPPGGRSGWCDLFLKPPWTPMIVDALLTNFHLPGSSLLALVAGFLGERGVEIVKALYKEAIDREYRFFSYGDAMLIL